MRQGVALAIRVRDDWSLLLGLLEHLGSTVSEVWILDDASLTVPPSELNSFSARPVVFRARHWSGSRGGFGEGIQRDYLLQQIKRHSRCAWVLQLDADERLADPACLSPLISQEDVDAWVMPLVDYYITPADSDLVDRTQPGRVREWFGVETRWTLTLFRPTSRSYVSRGDVREPQGYRRSQVRETSGCLVEHFGKAVSVADWDRKLDFYVSNYPEYRDKWLARSGRAVHKRFSDFGTPLVRRGDPSFDPDFAPVLHRYRVEDGLRAGVKAIAFGLLGLSRSAIFVTRQGLDG